MICAREVHVTRYIGHSEKGSADVLSMAAPEQPVLRCSLLRSAAADRLPFALRLTGLDRWVVACVAPVSGELQTSLLADRSTHARGRRAVGDLWGTSVTGLGRTATDCLPFTLRLARLNR